MTPEWLNFPRVSAQSQSASAAVLLLLKGATLADAAIVLTHRSPSMRSHSGQIAFPGGHAEPRERAADTALREAAEETGLVPETVTVFDQWHKYPTVATAQWVSPVLAYWHKPHPLEVASPAELDDVFLAPVRDLAAPENRLMVHFKGMVGPAFWHDGYLIWGFTGTLLNDLLSHAGWETEWDRGKVLDLVEMLSSSRNNEQRW